MTKEEFENLKVGEKFILGYRRFETKSTTRTNFKDCCRKQKLNFEDFIEVFSGEYIIRKRGKEKRFFYYRKGGLL